MGKIGQVTALAATLLTTDAAAENNKNPVNTEKQELVTAVVDGKTTEISNKVDVTIKQREEEARQKAERAEMSKNILGMSEEQFEEIKAEIEPDLELMKPQEVMAFAQAYVKALKPELDKANQELDKYKQAVKDAPKGSDQRTKAIKDYKEFKASSAYAPIEKRYDYFANHASTAALILEKQETAEKNDELIAEKQKTAGKNKQLAKQNKRLSEQNKRLSEQDKQLAEKDAEIKRTGDKLRAAIAAKLASQTDQ